MLHRNLEISTGQEFCPAESAARRLRHVGLPHDGINGRRSFPKL
jgi:hypothetical protein